MFRPMTAVSSINLSDEDRLDTLQRLDQFRHWHSLDEKRYCLVCGEIITGRQIRVIMDTRGNRLLRVICPTKHCDSMPIEWVWPTDDLLIKIAMVEIDSAAVDSGRMPQRATSSIRFSRNFLFLRS